MAMRPGILKTLEPRFEVSKFRTLALRFEISWFDRHTLEVSKVCTRNQFRKYFFPYLKSAGWTHETCFVHVSRA